MTMKRELREKLLQLSPELLVDVLLELVPNDYEIEDMLEVLTSTPKGKASQFKKVLSAVARMQSQMSLDESMNVIESIKTSLKTLKASEMTPSEKLEQLMSLYQIRDKLISCSSHKDPLISLFQKNIASLFIKSASSSKDKEQIAVMMLQFVQNDPYYTREKLVDRIEKYLPKPMVRMMISKIRTWFYHEKDEDMINYYYHLLDSFMQSLWRNSPLDRLSFDEYMKDFLISDDIKNNTNSDLYYLYRDFRFQYSTYSLEEILDIVGHDQREKVIEDEIAVIMKSSTIRSSAVQFLLEIDKIDEAAAYLLKRVHALSDVDSSDRDTWGEQMITHNKPLVAYILYRAGIDDIFDRRNVNTKLYPYGVNCLIIMDKLSKEIKDWQGIENHVIYKNALQELCGSKRTFWTRYDASSKGLKRQFPHLLA